MKKMQIRNIIINSHAITLFDNDFEINDMKIRNPVA